MKILNKHGKVLSYIKAKESFNRTLYYERPKTYEKVGKKVKDLQKPFNSLVIYVVRQKNISDFNSVKKLSKEYGDGYVVDVNGEDVFDCEKLIEFQIHYSCYVNCVNKEAGFEYIEFNSVKELTNHLDYIIKAQKIKNKLLI